ncbi:MAG TPA: ABC transporter substrate-binding protein [Pseudolabrys sp.]|jgi:branched-chain amino acid transport system substrate-binding protein|nr:ABC transporter substrate-binding protein [Pseudolabrys sp.]
MQIKGRGQLAARLAALSGGLVVVPVLLMGVPAEAADPIKVGWVGPLSPPGGYAEGALMKQAAQLAADEINAKGGVLGRPIEVVFQDTRGQPEEGTAVAERLISQDHVVAITGEFHSSVFLAEMEVAHNANIPIIAVDVWALKITGKGYPEVFRVAPNQALIAGKYGEWIAAAGFKNVAVLYEKTDGGQSARDVLLPILDKHGVKYEVVGADPNATEFTAQIERFKSHTPPFDFFMTEFSEAGAYPLVSQSHTLGFAPTPQTGIANSGGPAVDPTFWKNVGDAGKYLLTEIVGLPKNAWNDTTKAFVAAFKQKYSEPASPQAIENYDAMLVLADAIKRANSTDGKALIAALEKTDIVLGRGRYRFSTSHEPDWAYHQFMEAPVALVQYDKTSQDAEDAPIVWPRDIADVKYTYLKPGQ